MFNEKTMIEAKILIDRRKAFDNMDRKRLKR